MNGILKNQTLSLQHLLSKHNWSISLFTWILFTTLSFLFFRLLPYEIYYTFPIIISIWYGPKNFGLYVFAITILELISVNTFYQSNYNLNSSPYIFNYIVYFSSLTIFTTYLKNIYKKAEKDADTDPVTNAFNSRKFHAELSNEMERSARYKHPFSLAYLDIDKFKSINDTYGHSEGDDLLRDVANVLRESLRSTDVIARIGGDEFACLLPETCQKEAKIAFIKASENLENRMAILKREVGFSVGLVTFENIPGDINCAIKIADELMYSVKKSQKNISTCNVSHGCV